MTWIFVLVLSIGQSQTPGLSEMECLAAVRLAPVAVAEFGPDVHLVEARCEREPA